MSTLVNRLTEALYPGPALVPIEMVELSLVSLEPIVVTYDGGIDSFFDVFVTINPATPSSGSMMIYWDGIDSGLYTFNSMEGGGIYVYPRFVFTPVDGGTELILDSPDPILLESIEPYPWTAFPSLLACFPENEFFPLPGVFVQGLLNAGGAGHHWVTPPRAVDGCCLPDGTCIDIDAGDCVAIGGIPQGAMCTGTVEACCLGDGACRMLDPLCCDEAGGVVVSGAVCAGSIEACCDGFLPYGCMDADSMCCGAALGGTAQGGGTMCLGDGNGDLVDDACQTPQLPQACCLPDGTCNDITHDDCVALGGDPQGQGTTCQDVVCRELKWSQPPMFNPASPYPECFWGWDEPSEYWGMQLLADDWLCTDPRPITDIHWWGSYRAWADIEPPPQAPVQFHIGIWTDVPAGVDQPWSHPGVMIHEWVVDRADLNERLVGCDYEPTHMVDVDSCFRYDFFIPEGEWFHQGPASTIYWISIGAIYLTPYDFPWGWKTREHYFMDDAIRITDPTDPWIGSEFWDGYPIELGWDLAFVLTSEGEPEGACCLGDNTCIQTTAADCASQGGVFEGAGVLCRGIEACCLPQGGGCVDVDALCCVLELGGAPLGSGTVCSPEEACCLSDGTCVMADPDCCSQVMGGVPQGASTTCTVEEACCLTDGTCVMLDPLCCDEQGGTPQGNSTVCTEPEACCFDHGVCEDLDPLCCVDLGGTPQGPQTGCTDTTVACCLPTGECVDTDPLCCDDLGGTSMGPGSMCTVPEACCFGNGTCADLDPLCCADLGGASRGPGSVCLGDINGNTIDDACELIKWDQPVSTEYSGLHAHDYAGGQIIIADQWICEGGLVTDIHWWGSYEASPGAGPLAGFHLSIHPNLPGEPWCLPGPEIWGVDIMVGQFYEFPTGLVNNQGEPIFLYEYFLEVPFEQIQGEIYWLDISALSLDVGAPVLWKWQEMQRTETPIICPAAEQTIPPGSWISVGFGSQPTYWSDMAFRITSANLQEVPDPPDPEPDAVPKNRYISFMPGNAGSQVALRVTHTSTGTQWWVKAHQAGDPADIFRLDTSPYYTDWSTEPAVIHVGDCGIAPVMTYEVQALDITGDPADESHYSAALTVPTISLPAPKYWADCVGSFTGAWTGPNGIVNMSDIQAALQRFSASPSAPPLVWVDVDGLTPNAVMNMTDVQRIVSGFAGAVYPFIPPETCP